MLGMYDLERSYEDVMKFIKVCTLPMKCSVHYYTTNINLPIREGGREGAFMHVNHTALNSSSSPVYIDKVDEKLCTSLMRNSSPDNST